MRRTPVLCSLVLVAAATATSLTTASAAPAPAPAEAEAPGAALSPNAYPIVLSGDFTGDGQGDLFFFAPSAEPEVLYEINGDVGTPGWIDIYTYSMQGDYKPFAGDFSADGRDDIFWYRPGTGSDVIWDFKGTSVPPSYVTRSTNVSGSYRPVVGNFMTVSPGQPDDIFWYGPGSVADSVWDYSKRACCPISYASKPMSVGGSSYLPVAGSFIDGTSKGDDIFWYNPSGAESLWWFESGQPIHKLNLPALQVSGSSYKLGVFDLFEDGYEDIVFGAPGPAKEYLWDFMDGFVYQDELGIPFDGTFTQAVGVDDTVAGDPGDLFVSYPAETRGTYYDFVLDAGQVLYSSNDLDPTPLTAVPAPAAATTAVLPGATAAAPEGRRWVTPLRPG